MSGISWWQWPPIVIGAFAVWGLALAAAWVIVHDFGCWLADRRRQRWQERSRRYSRVYPDGGDVLDIDHRGWS